VQEERIESFVSEGTGADLKRELGGTLRAIYAVPHMSEYEIRSAEIDTRGRRIRVRRNESRIKAAQIDPTVRLA
jgi:hypothetical protein